MTRQAGGDRPLHRRTVLKCLGAGGVGALAGVPTASAHSAASAAAGRVGAAPDGSTPVDGVAQTARPPTPRFDLVPVYGTCWDAVDQIKAGVIPHPDGGVIPSALASTQRSLTVDPRLDRRLDSTSNPVEEYLDTDPRAAWRSVDTPGGISLETHTNEETGVVTYTVTSIRDPFSATYQFRRIDWRPPCPPSEACERTWCEIVRQIEVHEMEHRDIYQRPIDLANAAFRDGRPHPDAPSAPFSVQVEGDGSDADKHREAWNRLRRTIREAIDDWMPVIEEREEHRALDSGDYVSFGAWCAVCTDCDGGGCIENVDSFRLDVAFEQSPLAFGVGPEAVPVGTRLLEEQITGTFHLRRVDDALRWEGGGRVEGTRTDRTRVGVVGHVATGSATEEFPDGAVFSLERGPLDRLGDFFSGERPYSLRWPSTFDVTMAVAVEGWNGNELIYRETWATVESSVGAGTLVSVLGDPARITGNADCRVRPSDANTGGVWPVRWTLRWSLTPTAYRESPTMSC